MLSSTAGKYSDRRKELLAKIPENSIIILKAGHEKLRSADTHYRFRQNNQFLYLTGFEESEAIAILEKTNAPKLTLFVSEPDPEHTRWIGPRAGVKGACDEFGADEAFPLKEFDTKLSEIVKSRAHTYLSMHNDRDVSLKRKIKKTLKTKFPCRSQSRIK